MTFIQLFVSTVVLFSPQTAYAAPHVAAAPTIPVVMLAIADCESGGIQYHANGRLVRDYLTGDHIGIYQLSYKLYYREALKLGMNIKKPEGNIAYALHLYNLHGTRDWLASSRCWNRAIET